MDGWTMVARWFDYRNAQPRNEGWFIDDLVFFSSQGREDGKLLDMRAKLVIRQALKWIGRPSSLYTSTTLVLLALAHVDPEEPNLKPDWYAWVSEQISSTESYKLNHKKRIGPALQSLGGLASSCPAPPHKFLVPNGEGKRKNPSKSTASGG
ncbi:hypothetical protein R1flu_003924 [Riccia fluitans]|uniref:Uncharacterized protein n=1 Tax=Riccia fluitans TaxID=41844 RepID=A0ABD1XEN4_9MARC